MTALYTVYNRDTGIKVGESVAADSAADAIAYVALKEAMDPHVLGFVEIEELLDLTDVIEDETVEHVYPPGFIESMLETVEADTAPKTQEET